MEPSSQNQTTLTRQVLKSGGDVDAHEIEKLDSLSKEAQSIENSFTEYIVPEHEKTLVSSMFHKVPAQA
jgi:hypothetical protein